MVYRFDAPDLDYLRMLAQLPPGRRVRVMLEARALAVGLMRGRLRRQFPDLSQEAINLKLLEEIDHAEQGCPRP
jgi:hypothetical protein